MGIWQGWVFIQYRRKPDLPSTGLKSSRVGCGVLSAGLDGSPVVSLGFRVEAVQLMTVTRCPCGIFWITVAYPAIRQCPFSVLRATVWLSIGSRRSWLRPDLAQARLWAQAEVHCRHHVRARAAMQTAACAGRQAIPVKRHDSV